jgi:Zn-dependent peptidase ImmA (M78 family)/transcriptional regulator with XRE-family HTH domain
MGERVVGINPRMLTWARESAGKTVEEVASALKKDPEVILQWGKGVGQPTYPQLEALAYKALKRPIAVFFFPGPPDEPDPESSFRVLPATVIGQLSSDTRLRIRDAFALQLSLSELCGGVHPSRRRILRERCLLASMEISEAAAWVREFLGAPIELQLAAWPKDAGAVLNRWRDLVDDVGISVFKHPFKQLEISGFCLHDDKFPVIMINSSTSKTRQIFTLIHELAHLLFQRSGITQDDETFLDQMIGIERAIEVFCNRFAAEFLVPNDWLCRQIEGTEPKLSVVERTASLFSVSREVILRRFLDLGLVSKDEYEQKAYEWNEEFTSRRKQRHIRGPSYYRTRASYLGRRFLRLAFARHYEGRISRAELASHLGVDCLNMSGFLERMKWRF